ncbi:exocyst complex component Exo84 [Brevipalpus obovatus]|uniref:exocyst complex component Exo84 n=1 Tax=Brevipalpus obovatus TaxID=246614 RepID=UPI003D9E6D76
MAHLGGIVEMNPDNFNPDTFLRELSRPNIGPENLQIARKKVQKLCDETNAELKKNVYKNYASFIEAAKEIAFLKSEMSKLAKLLAEEQNLLCSLQELSICGDKQHSGTGTTERQDSMKTSDGRRLSMKSESDGPSFDKLGTSIFVETELLEEECEQDSEMVPLWLTELSEDLDVCIAQRAFEDAVELVHKFNDHFTLYPKLVDDPSQAELRSRINAKIEDLIKAVSKELETVPDQPVQSGPRAARRAVNLLLRLGRSSSATELFLVQRGAILRYCLMQQKKEGATFQYIERMSTVFFSNVQESCKEFQRAFGLNSGGSSFASLSGTLSSADSLSLNNGTEKASVFSPSMAMACLVSWVKKKLKHFLDSFCVHVFTTQVPASVASDCVALVYQHCRKLRAAVHFDLVFYCDQRLRNGIERIINETREKLLEAIRHRCGNDRWLPQNFSNKPAVTKFLEEMKESGFPLHPYVYDECKISLTSNTTSFAKSYYNSLRDLVKLSTPLTHKLVITAIVAPLEAHFQHIEKALRDNNLRSQRNTIALAAAYLGETLLPKSIEYCRDKLGSTPEELVAIRNKYAQLKIEPSEPVRTHRTPTHSDRHKRSPQRSGPLRETKTTFSTTTYL